jgi:hypothetical protein
VIGLGLAAPFGFTSVFVSTPAVYLGSGGFALTLTTIHWASSRVHGALEQLRPIFLIGDDQYYGLITRWFGRLVSRTGTLASFVCIFGVSVAGVVLGMATSDDTRRRWHLMSLRPTLFPTSWYELENRVPAVAILVVSGALFSLALATASRMLVLNLRFVWQLSQLPVIPMPTLVRARLRRLVDLYVGASLAWAVGVALFGTLYYKDYDPLSGSIVVSLFLLGLLTFAIPQLVCRQYIIRSYDSLCAAAMACVYLRLGITLDEREMPNRLLVAQMPTNPADLEQLTGRPKTWVYDSQDVFIWLATQAVAFLAIFAHDALAGLLR